jgi:hypothetical protein
MILSERVNSKFPLLQSGESMVLRTSLGRVELR